jgi:hypothetical protein
MKRWKSLLLLPILALLVVFALSSPARSAFHDGSEASCEGCHQADYSLKGADPSSTCLGCHASTYRVLSDDGSAYTPAGDFYWLTQSYASSDPLGQGERHGHNVIAEGFGLFADSTLWSAPSAGSVIYQSAWLQCTSCHDPHSTAQKSYRLLGSTGYDGGSRAAGISFSHPAPRALACLGQDGNLQAETDSDHPDYGEGMSEWCSNCHSGFISHGTHPAGSAIRLGRVATHYNVYLGTGNLAPLRSNTYDFLVPFERGRAETGTLRCARTDGPSTNANVMCLSCHRAHASAFDAIGRWDFGVDVLSNSAVLFSPDGRHAYYGNDVNVRYSPLQRSLCNKCHGTDRTR